MPLSTYSYQLDSHALHTGVSVCQSLLKTRSLHAIEAEPTDVTSSTCSARGMYDASHPQYWRCLVGRNSRTVYHYSGTCKMGAATDHTAVVDPQLRSVSHSLQYNIQYIQYNFTIYNITLQYNTVYNTTLLPSVNTLIALFCGAKYTHHTFTPIIKHSITTTANKHPQW